MPARLSGRSRVARFAEAFALESARRRPELLAAPLWPGRTAWPAAPVHGLGGPLPGRIPGRPVAAAVVASLRRSSLAAEPLAEHPAARAGRPTSGRSPGRLGAPGRRRVPSAPARTERGRPGTCWLGRASVPQLRVVVLQPAVARRGEPHCPTLRGASLERRAVVSGRPGPPGGSRLAGRPRRPRAAVLILAAGPARFRGRGLTDARRQRSGPSAVRTLDGE